MFFFPIGLEDAVIRRMPWVAIGIASLLLLVFAGLKASPPPETDAGGAQALFVYYLKHPDVHPTKKLLKQIPGLGGILSSLPSKAGAAATSGKSGGISMVSPAEHHRHQAQFDALTQKYLAAQAAQPSRAQWGLVPADGVVQRGSITGPFITHGYLAIAWDLLLLYMVAPFLEDAWGRLAFGGLFAGGALVASGLWVALAHGSQVPVYGPAGALAACFGAFSVRFASRKVRFLWWFPLRKFGTFSVPAWTWAVFWLANACLWLWLGSILGIASALVPSLAAFAFGAAAAVVVKATDFEAKYITPAVEGESFEQHASVLAAADALGQGDRDGARAAYGEALRADPGNVDALLGLARLELDTGDAAAATRHLDRLLTGCLARQDLATVELALGELGGRLDRAALRPATAYRAATVMEDRLAPGTLELLYQVAAGGAGALGEKARRRASELGLTAAPAAPPSPAPATPSAAPAVAVRVIPSRFAGRVEAGYQVTRPDGRLQPLPAARVQAVAAGIVERFQTPEGTAANVVVLDLVLARDATTVRGLRMTSRDMGLETLFPGMAPPQAFQHLVAELLAVPGLAPLPPRLAQGLPRHPDLAAFEAEAYAPA